jgi:ornithine cyclodeaminase
VKILVLAGHHVRELLPYRECADVMREALAELARGQTQQPLRTIVRPRDAAGFMGLMPAYSPGAGYGLKAICVTPGNPAIGKDAHQGGVLLFDVHTGEPLALVNASAVTEIRTAATSAVATDLLARPGAAELAVIGTGVRPRRDPAADRDPPRRTRPRADPRGGRRSGRAARPAGHRP